MKLLLILSVIVVIAVPALAGDRVTTQFLDKASHRGWTLSSNRGAAMMMPVPINMLIGVKQRNIDLLEEYFLRVSNPKSDSFGKYLTLQELADMTAVPENTDAIVRWLRESGVQAKAIQPSINGEFIKLTIEKSHAEKVFSANFFPFVSGERTIYRSPSFSLPDEIDAIVDYVSGISDFYRMRTTPRIMSYELPKEAIQHYLGTGSFPVGYATPAVIAKHYNISDSTVASTQATQSVFETLSQSFNPTDLSNFQQEMNVKVQAAAQVIGPNDPSACSANPNNCGEANLDIQYIMGVAQNAPTTFWSIAASDTQPYLDFLYAVANTTNPPLVHSISYGDDEFMDNQQQMAAFNTEVMKLGTRGITVMVASGDDGVANFIARGNKSACGFTPSFPATSPYVTAVGATMGPENDQPEIACQSDKGGLITTGGGFSSYFDAPTWQNNAVQNYLATAKLPPSGMFRSAGRGYPDVSALGHNYIIEDGGSNIVVSGTSAASPVFAATVTLANGLRLAQGKAPLGFLNQILYQLAESNPSVFHDITSGENNCCAGQSGQETCCTYGFYAQAGWDPLTGLGSPDFANFGPALLAL